MVTSVPNVTVCTVIYITPPVHWSIICDYFVMVMGLYNIILYINHKLMDDQGMGSVHETTDTNGLPPALEIMPSCRAIHSFIHL